MESVVRDLSNVINDLRIKITDLECKVDDQNKIIYNQIDVISKLKIAIEGRSQLPPRPISTQPAQLPKNASNPSLSSCDNVRPPAALQRPVRQARLKSKCTTVAAAAKNATAATQISANGAENCEPTASEMSKTEVTRSEISNTLASTANETTLSPSSCVATKPDLSHEREPDEWQIIRRRVKNKTPRRIVSGSGDNNTEIQAAERMKYIQAWSFRPETTADNVTKHLNNIVKCDKYFIEKRQIKSDNHAAFVIGFPECFYEQICTPSAWPPGVKVSDWFLRRPRRACDGREQGAEH
ncbi:hypothetical protein K1T71_015297 [Dendrolimus kikuchii]|nr:hypothetical protein K1T71_015297 [Dendrolimus kikuchii]